MQRRRGRCLRGLVDRYIDATNSGDLERLVAIFVSDAVVNDQFEEHRGVEEITRWARFDVMADSLRLTLVDWKDHYGSAIVTAHADGVFDKRGLPDPLILKMYLSGTAGRIVQLIILRDYSGT
jgi:ketosteroid isomerase-like protein